MSKQLDELCKKNPNRQEALKPPGFLGSFLFFLFNRKNLEKKSLSEDMYVVFSFPNGVYLARGGKKTLEEIQRYRYYDITIDRIDLVHPPPRMPVTTSIITFLAGHPYKDHSKP